MDRQLLGTWYASGNEMAEGKRLKVSDVDGFYWIGIYEKDSREPSETFMAWETFIANTRGERYFSATKLEGQGNEYFFPVLKETGSGFTLRFIHEDAIEYTFRSPEALRTAVTGRALTIVGLTQPTQLRRDRRGR